MFLGYPAQTKKRLMQRSAEIGASATMHQHQIVFIVCKKSTYIIIKDDKHDKDLDEIDPNVGEWLVLVIEVTPEGQQQNSNIEQSTQRSNQRIETGKPYNLAELYTN